MQLIVEDSTQKLHAVNKEYIDEISCWDEHMTDIDGLQETFHMQNAWAVCEIEYLTANFK